MLRINARFSKRRLRTGLLLFPRRRFARCTRETWAPTVRSSNNNRSLALPAWIAAEVLHRGSFQSFVSDEQFSSMQGINLVVRKYLSFVTERVCICKVALNEEARARPWEDKGKEGLDSIGQLCSTCHFGCDRDGSLKKTSTYEVGSA